MRVRAIAGLPRPLLPKGKGLLLSGLLLLLVGCPTEPPPVPGDDDDSSDDGGTSAGPYVVDASALSSLELSNSLGGAQIIGEVGRTKVEVLLTEVGSETVTENLPDDIFVQVEVVGTRLIADVSGELAEDSPGLNIRLLTPPSLAYSLNIGVGSAQVSRMSSAGSLLIEEGSLLATQVLGDLDASITQGEADIQAVLPLWGGIDISLGSGDIRLEIPQETSAQLEAVADTGTVYLLGLELAGVHTEGQAFGVLGDGEGTLTLSSQIGDIYVEGASDE